MSQAFSFIRMFIIGTSLALLIPNTCFGINENVDLPDCSLIEQKDFIVDSIFAGRFAKDRNTLESLYCFSKRIEHHKIEVISLINLAIFNYETDDFKSVGKFIDYLHVALQISESYEEYDHYFTILELIITQFTDHEMIETASIFNQEFIDKAYFLNDSTKISEGHMLFGRVLRQNNNFIESEVHLKKALDFAKTDRIKGYTYLHLCKLYNLKEDYEQSVYYGEKGILPASKVSNRESVFMLSMLAYEIVLSKLAINKFDNDSHFELLKKEGLKDKFVAYHYYFALGLSESKQHHLTAAKQAYYSAIENSEQINQSILSNQAIDNLLLLEVESKSFNEIAKLLELYNQNEKEIKEQQLSANLFTETYLMLKEEKSTSKILKNEVQYYIKIVIGVGIFALLVMIITFLIYKQYMLRKRMNDTLDEMNFKLEKQNKELEAFAGMAAHDIKAPIRTINSLVQIFNNDKIQNKDEVIQLINSSSERMNSLIEDLLFFSKSGSFPEVEEPCSFDEVMAIVKHNLEQPIHDRKAEIFYAEKLPSLKVHPSALTILLQNLISNAIKFTEKDRFPEIYISSFQTDTNYVIQVKDNGIGVAKDDIDKIVKPFHRSARTSRIEGTGLGLSTCNRIMENYGGMIEFESTVNEGTTIHLKFPLHFLF